MRPTNFAAHLTAFLANYLPAQRNLSPNTIRAYRDAFVLLLRYCRDVRRLAPDRLSLEQIDPPLVLDFLDHLEKERRCAARTRNLRLTAVHAFFRYLQTEEPGLLLGCQRILAIPLQRCAAPAVEYLSPESLAAILRQPDLTRRTGRRDAVLLSLLYDTGARVQELIDLSVRDVRLEVPAQVRLTGKGRKARAVPLMSSTVDLLRDYLHEHGLIGPERLDEPLFRNRFGGRLSRSGIRYLVEKYVRKAGATRPAVSLPKVSPHTFRHSKAMHLLQADNPLVVIRDFLGHADIKSTEIYARADLDMKRRALEKAGIRSPTPSLPSWQKDQGLLEWLTSL
jgi:site-specific recombinase XerD